MGFAEFAAQFVAAILERVASLGKFPFAHDAGGRANLGIEETDFGIKTLEASPCSNFARARYGPGFAVRIRCVVGESKMGGRETIG